MSTVEEKARTIQETISGGMPPNSFPYRDHRKRLQNYDYYERLFLGEHFSAFKIKIEDPAFNKAYAKLRYIAINFAGMLSKIVADMLFSEPILIRAGDKGDQEFIDALVYENKLDQQFYEAALANSYFGDQIFKMRIGKRHEAAKKSTIFVEDNTPKVYFPKTNPDNIREEPAEHEFAWIITKDKLRYVRKEIHKIGAIINELWLLNDDNTFNKQVDITAILGVVPQEDTRIDRSMIIHTPNWRSSGMYFGISDYNDLDSLMFAINNRFSKIDNVLDKHTDPILAVPEGVLDETGRVRREALNMIEISPEAGREKPEYIVWNANLEAAFSQIDKLIEVFYMTSEMSPAVFGMDKGGAAESGRALKLKLLRTIAKTSRKKLYFQHAIVEAIYTAQFLAKEWDVEVDGVKLSKAPAKPELVWADGLPIDLSEAIEDEVKQKDAELTTTKDSLMRLYHLTDKQAQEKVREIEKQNTVDIPPPNMSRSPFIATDKTDKADKPDKGA